LNAELSHHLGYAAGADKPEPLTNHRNGSTAKTVLTGDGTLLTAWQGRPLEAVYPVVFFDALRRGQCGTQMGPAGCISLGTHGRPGPRSARMPFHGEHVDNRTIACMLDETSLRKCRDGFES